MGELSRGGTALLHYGLKVNGRDYEVRDAELCESLLYVLRERLELHGAKNACLEGECGSCSVLVDGVLECACMVLAAAVAGSDVVTIEGLSPAGGELSDVQEAFVTEGAVQCGFCTPGLIVSVYDFLSRNPVPTDLEVREAISGNLCRCTGYGRILAAVHAVAAARSSAGGAPG